MTCPKCNNEKTKIVDSRADEESVWRRRECQGCGYRFNTIEIDEDYFEKVVKKHDKR